MNAFRNLTTVCIAASIVGACHDVDAQNETVADLNSTAENMAAREDQTPAPRCTVYREQMVAEYDRKLDKVSDDGSSFICITGILPTRMIETVRQLNRAYEFDAADRRYFAGNFVKFPFRYTDAQGRKFTLHSPEQFIVQFDRIFAAPHKQLFEGLDYADFEANAHTPGAMYPNGAIWLTADDADRALFTSFFPDALPKTR